jgi:general secretion pathway protein A
MYPSSWGIDASPFRACLDPKRFYQSPTHEEALARLHFLVDQRRRMGLLMGPPGSGKSLVLTVFADELRRDGLPAGRLDLVGVQPGEMFSLLAGQLGRSVDPSAPVPVAWRALCDRLSEFRYQQLPAIVLLDDADQATAAVRAQVARLARFDRSPEMQLTMVLSGQQRRMGLVGHALLELADLRIDLAPWEPADTERFVEASLRQAGCRSAVFARPAIERLHELSGGIPRRVSRLADLALLAGAGLQADQIDAELVESVHHELGVV